MGGMIHVVDDPFIEELKRQAKENIPLPLLLALGRGEIDLRAVLHGARVGCVARKTDSGKAEAKSGKE